MSEEGRKGERGRILPLSVLIGGQKFYRIHSPVHILFLTSLMRGPRPAVEEG